MAVAKPGTEISIKCEVSVCGASALARRNQKSVKKEKAAKISLNSLYLSRRLPTLPHTFACSTIGPAGLNLRRLRGV